MKVSTLKAIIFGGLVLTTASGASSIAAERMVAVTFDDLPGPPGRARLERRGRSPRE